MKAYLNLLVLSALAWSACSPGDGPTDTGSVATPSDGFEEDPLAIATYGGGVFAKNERFAAYSFIADRVSVIDPELERETWGRRMNADFKAVFPLPEVSAVGLVRESEFRVVGREDQLSFSFSINLTRWQWARSARVAVFNDQTIGGATVVRNQTDGTWKTDRLEYPNVQKFVVPPAPLISYDGLTVVELFLADAPAYVVYRAEDIDSKMETKLTCQVDVAAYGDDIDFSRIFAASAGPDWLIVSLENKIAPINIKPGAACITPESLQFTQVVNDGPIRRVLIADDDRVVLASESGELVMVAIDGSGAVSVTEDFGKPCALPAGLNNLGGDMLAVTCATGFNRNKRVDEVAILIIDLDSNKKLFEHTIELKRLAAVAVDPSKKKIFEFLDGGLGELRITELTSGATRSVRGLFIEGILDKL